MKRKTILTLALGCMLCVALVAVGVYAVSFLKLSLAGQINFVDYDKLMYVEQIEVKNYVEISSNGQYYQAKSKILDSYKGAYLNKQNGVSAIDISTLNVINGEPLIIEITLISLYDVDLYASVTNTEVAGITVSAPATRLPANAGQSILTGEKAVFVITITNTSSTVVNLASLSICISFETQSLPIYSDVDATGAIYYYVEMGQLANGAKIRWRYMADVSGTKHNNTSAPTTLSGYYILETEEAAISKKYLANYSGAYHTSASGYGSIYTCDYATSDIRAYVKSETFLTDLKISKDDTIYQMITARTMEDLYSSITTGAGDVITAANTNYGLSVAGMPSQSDKFWIPSSSEIRDMLCGGTYDANIARWGMANNYGTYYWTRSPKSTNSVDYIVNSGKASIDDLMAVRAGFKIG